MDQRNLSNNENPVNRDTKTIEGLANASSPSVAHEFVLFLRHNKKWWLAPIVMTLAVIALVVALGGTAAAPWIYALF